MASRLPPLYFTVFTPTHNRAHTLSRVYESLRAQTDPRFEWVVVDDGSTDCTAETVAAWRSEADFPIRYLHQDNRGKHVAFNRAVREARGDLFLALDSDDECAPQALERFAHHWSAIPDDERSAYCGVTALCADQTGRLVGTRFPADPTDSDALELQYRHRVVGEKWGFNRTDVLRDHPFPEVADQPFVTESVVWNRIAATYRTRYVNEILRTYYRHEDDQSLTESAREMVDRAPMFALKNRLILNEEIAWLAAAPSRFLRAAANYARFSWHGGDRLRSQAGALSGARAKALHLLMAPVGAVIYHRDRLRERPEKT